MFPSCIPKPSTTSTTAKPQPASEAVAAVNPEQWGRTSVRDRLAILHQLRRTMKQHVEELSRAIADGRNELVGAAAMEERFQYTQDRVKACAGSPPAYHITVLIDLYERLLNTGTPLPPAQVIAKGDGMWDVQVLPVTTKEQILFEGMTMFLRVQGKNRPKQVHPLDQPPGICAVLAGGNTASAVEVLKAIFLQNQVVVFKGHPLNARSDAIWQKIYQPLQDAQAISYCWPSDGPALISQEAHRLSSIYFTGSTHVARSIRKGLPKSKPRLVTECGGVNPVLIVPGSRPWTEVELDHIALQIVSTAKLFGGAICGRPQLIVTCSKWDQRPAFCTALERSIRETRQVASFYPGSISKLDDFYRQYPSQAVLVGEERAARFLWIPGMDVQSNPYLLQTEAFCQVLGETALDTEPNPEAFLQAAVPFCNHQLFGSLTCTIVIDDESKSAHYSKALERAIADLRYGAISVNGNATFLFTAPQLIWGGCGEDDRDDENIKTGCGNFGNALGYANVEKSILYVDFNKFERPTTCFSDPKAWDRYLAEGVRLLLDPSWWNLIAYPIRMVWGGLFGR